MKILEGPVRWANGGHDSALVWFPAACFELPPNPEHWDISSFLLGSLPFLRWAKKETVTNGWKLLSNIREWRATAWTVPFQSEPHLAMIFRRRVVPQQAESACPPPM